MKLILVRHGETQLNKEGRIQGINDVPLTTTGTSQAQALAKALAEDMPFWLYTSPLPRAFETCRIVSESLQVSAVELEGLKEADVGRLEGLTGQEMRQRYPEFARHWDRDSGATQMPGGESLLQVQQRAWPAVKDLKEKHSNDTVVAVTHNFVMQTIICKVLDMPLHRAQRLRHELGSIARLEIGHSQGELVSLNETWHLSSLVPAEGGPAS